LYLYHTKDQTNQRKITQQKFVFCVPRDGISAFLVTRVYITVGIKNGVINQHNCVKRRKTQGRVTLKVLDLKNKVI
jgi:hypothetical protein